MVKSYRTKRHHKKHRGGEGEVPEERSIFNMDEPTPVDAPAPATPSAPATPAPATPAPAEEKENKSWLSGWFGGSKKKYVRFRMTQKHRQSKRSSAKRSSAKRSSHKSKRSSAKRSSAKRSSAKHKKTKRKSGSKVRKMRGGKEGDFIKGLLTKFNIWDPAGFAQSLVAGRIHNLFRYPPNFIFTAVELDESAPNAKRDESFVKYKLSVVDTTTKEEDSTEVVFYDY